MKSLTLRALVPRLLLILAGLLFAVTASAAKPLDSADVDQWLATTSELVPMRAMFERIANESALTQKYTQKAFKAMEAAQQDKIVDQLLKDEAVYDQVYQVLHKHSWPNAGDYVRVSSRMAVAVQAHMQNVMLQNLPAAQARIVQEMMGGSVNAPSQDVALVRRNWDKISTFVGQHITPAQLLSIM